MLPEALAHGEAHRRALFGALRTPIITTTLGGRISGFNAAAVALLGSPARLYGRAIREVLPFAADCTPDQFEFQGRLADATGRSVDLEVSRTQLGGGGEPGAVIYVIHDISRHAEVNRLREQLLYSVAHELRGPLMILDNTLEILDTEYADLSAAEFGHLVASARRTAQRMRTLMEDLLSAGAIQSGNFVVAPRPTDLARLVNDALEIVSPALAAHGQHVEVCLPARAHSIMADPRYARQVLTNLLTNASKYGPPDSTVRIKTTQMAKMVRISVEDQGPGIPPERRAGLFERFYRIRDASDEPGIGLGLAIAKGIVEAHGGSMGVDSEVGRGTSVWFTLPTAAGRATQTGGHRAHSAGR
jgi:signal transduction histidine kinase